MAENGLHCYWNTQRVPKFLSVSLYLLPFARYCQLPVSRVTRSRKWKMTENGLPCDLTTQWIPNFCPFRSLTIFEISPTSCLEDHVTSEIKNGRKWVTLLLGHPVGPKFLSVSLYLLPFSRHLQLTVSRVTWPRKIKIAQKWVTLTIEHPAGPKFAFVSLYHLPVSRYHQLPVPRVTWPWKLTMAENGIPCHLNT